MGPLDIALVGAVFLCLACLVFRWSMKRASRRLLADFMANSPGRCPICAFHEYGIRQGHCKPGTPVNPHPCIEGVDPDSPAVRQIEEALRR